MNQTSQIILYSYFRSSAAYRVRIALNLKKIPYQYIPVHLIKNGGEQFSDEYKKLNPLSQVPCLVHNGNPISQSMAIMQYLEDICPEPYLFPRKPFERALVLQMCETINSGIQPLQNISVTNELEKKFKISEDDKKNWIAYWNHKGLQALELLLAKTAGPYCMGEKITAADCYLIPQVFSARRFGVDLSGYPNILRVNEEMLALPDVKAASPDHQPDSN